MTDVSDFGFDGQRLPTSSISREDLRSGLIALPIIGVIYLYGGLYILNKKYFYPAVAHIISLLDEKYTAVVYCSLNMMIYLFIMLYSTLLAQDNIGISTILGSEAFNLLLVMGWVQFRMDKITTIDMWIFIKESMFYLGTLVFATIYFSFNAINWWQALIWLIYFGIYALYFQKKNEPLRDKIALFFGLKDEDDVFSCAENYNMIRRRHSLKDILAVESLNIEDPELMRKIKRQEGALKIQLKDPSKFMIYSNFQRIVYKLAFALQAKINEEKKQRSIKFKQNVEQMYGRSNKKQKSLKADDGGDDAETNEVAENKKDEEEGLINKEGPNLYPYEANNDDAPPRPTPGPASQADVLGREENHDDNRELEIGNGEPNMDDLNNLSNPNIDEMLVFEDDNMSIPRSWGQKIVYFLFLPVNFLYFVVLFYFRKQPNIKTAAVSMLAILILQAVFTFLIIWWTEIVIDALDIPNEMAGVSVTSIGVSISFIAYNLKFQKSEKDANFLTTFQMVGIYKFGFAGSVGWLLSCAVENMTAYPNIIQGLQISSLIYLGMFVLSMAWIGISKARIQKKMSIPFGVGYIGFLIGSIIVLDYYRDTIW